MLKLILITLTLNSEVLLQVVNSNPHIPSYKWGDGSSYKRWVTAHDLPTDELSFNGKSSYLAVNDGFLLGLTDYEITFEFYAEETGSAVLACSNWATPNNGDWLLGFINGKLMHLGQKRGEPDQYFVTDSKPTINTWHLMKIKKQGDRIELYLNEKYLGSTPTDLYQKENGSPLVFGANHYDREGMNYFKGKIRNIKITK